MGRPRRLVARMLRFRRMSPAWPIKLLVVLWAALPATAALAAGPATAPSGPPVDFNRDVRPILSENCYYCHGQDPNHRKADLRLDVRAVAVKAEAIVPGKPNDSGLIARINTSDPEDLMPPPNSHRQLTAEQKDTFKRWI